MMLQGRAISLMSQSGFHLMKFLHQGLSVSVSSQGLHIAEEVESVKLKTFWTSYMGEVFGAPDQWPALKAVFDEGRGYIKKDITWTPPSYMRLWFITEHTLENTHGSTYLVCTMDGEVYRAPLPNVYSSGRICMGSHFNPEGSTSIECHHHAMSDFRESEFNSDLEEGQCQFLLIDPNDKPIHPEMNMYLGVLQVVSSSKLEFLKELI